MFAGTRFAAEFGTAALAAHQVAWQLWLFLALLLDSLAIAAQALVARCLGAGDPDYVRHLGRRLNLWGVMLGTVFAAAFLLLDNSLPRIFTQDPAVLAAIGTIFGLLALMQIPNAILFVLDGLLIGASDFAFLRNAMLALGVFGIVTTWIGATIGGSLLGVWIGISVFMMGRLVVMSVRWQSTFGARKSGSKARTGWGVLNGGV
jgi:MATE family multidrug resistance protein